MSEDLWAHGEVLIDLYEAEIAEADAGDLYRFFNRGVRLRGSVGGEFAVAAAIIRGEVGRAFAPGEKRAEGGTGGGVLDNAAACVAGQEFLGQSEHSYQPIEDVSLQFCAGGAGGPEHALNGEPGGNQV